MKTIFVQILSAAFTLSLASAKEKPPKKFIKLVEENGMQFNIPDSFKSIKVKDNPDMGYNYSIIHKKKKLEIRYSIFPLVDLVKNYEKSKTDTCFKAIEPNIRFGQEMMFASTYNIADTIIQDITAFDSLASKKEFGADWGAFSLVEPRTTFATGYSYCLLVAIHKNNIAEGYIMFLFDDLHDVENDVYKTSFYNLTFKQ